MEILFVRTHKGMIHVLMKVRKIDPFFNTNFCAYRVKVQAIMARVRATRTSKARGTSGTSPAKLMKLPMAPGQTKRRGGSRKTYEQLYKRLNKLKEGSTCTAKERNECIKKMNGVVRLIITQDKLAKQVDKMTNEIGVLEKKILRLSLETKECGKCAT